jgi:hypothetical protein
MFEDHVRLRRLLRIATAEGANDFLDVLFSKGGFQDVELSKHWPC